MRWSWTVARIKGIDVDIHATFLILLAWIGIAAYQQAHTAGAAIIGVLLTLAIFLSVVLHEFGHAIMAQRFGVSTETIRKWRKRGPADCQGHRQLDGV